MKLQSESLSEKMLTLYKNIIMSESTLSLEDLKDSLANKEKAVHDYLISFPKREEGKLKKKFKEDIEKIEINFRELHDNFDDKLMIFIIGNGNVGKSTLINALVGEKVAAISNYPLTWKIDVYTPEINTDTMIVKYANGEEKRINSKSAKEIIEEEERKCNLGKKEYNKHKNIELKKLKTREEKEEMNKYLADKYLYKSDITEVRWPVENNWLLEKCLLVDTPGLNQNLNDLEQLGDINDYYHKADGVILLLDGQSIAGAKAREMLDDLEKTLSAVGGIRENIIGVINRIDLVKAACGDEGVKRVEDSARMIFKDKLSNLLSISAQQAFEGIEKNNVELTNGSGILELQNRIREIFMAKAESLKNGAKSQGNKKLLQLTYSLINNYYRSIVQYEEIYNEKNKKLLEEKEKLKNDMEKEVEVLFNNYLDEVSRRVDLHIDELSNGEGPSFVKNNMYMLDEFLLRINKVISEKHLEIENKGKILNNIAKISEYKHIKIDQYKVNNNLVTNMKLNFSTLDSLDYFKPSSDNDLFSFLGNALGKTVFFFKKNGIKQKINNTIARECNGIKNKIKNDLNSCIDNICINSKTILDGSFEDLLFKYKNLQLEKKGLKKLKIALEKEKENIKLRDILGDNNER